MRHGAFQAEHGVRGRQDAERNHCGDQHVEVGELSTAEEKRLRQ